MGCSGSNDATAAGGKTIKDLANECFGAWGQGKFNIIPEGLPIPANNADQRAKNVAAICSDKCTFDNTLDKPEFGSGMKSYTNGDTAKNCALFDAIGAEFKWEPEAVANAKWSEIDTKNNQVTLTMAGGWRGKNGIYVPNMVLFVTFGTDGNGKLNLFKWTEGTAGQYALGMHKASLTEVAKHCFDMWAQGRYNIIPDGAPVPANTAEQRQAHVAAVFADSVNFENSMDKPEFNSKLNSYQNGDMKTNLALFDNIAAEFEWTPGFTITWSEEANNRVTATQVGEWAGLNKKKIADMKVHVTFGMNDQGKLDYVHWAEGTEGKYAEGMTV